MTERLLLTADRILAAPGSAPALADGGVVVRDDRVERVGPSRTLVADLGGEVEHRHYPGCTILPGLIDGHVHLTFTPRVDASKTVPNTPDDELVATVHAHSQELLSRGVTTTRDLGDRDYLVKRARDEAGPGEPLPRLLTAGPPITQYGGHCWFLGGETARDDSALRRAVHLHAEQGADWIKVMATGGNTTQDGARLWEPQFDERQLGALVAAADECDLPVAAHVHGAATIVAAAGAGVSTIEHCSLVNASGTGVEFDPTIAATLIEAGCWVSHADTFTWQAYAKALGEDVADALVTRTRWLADHGVALFAGTDSGVGEFDQLVQTLERQAHAFSAAELLATATVNAARALCLEDEVGTLADGMRADVLVVGGDPSADVTALREVRQVVLGGRLI